MRFRQICLVVIIAILALVHGQCLRPCPHNYAPVCGQDEMGTLTTYGNECAMEATACNTGRCK